MSARTDYMFDLFWAKVTQKATFLGFTDPQLSIVGSKREGMMMVNQ